MNIIIRKCKDNKLQPSESLKSEKCNNFKSEKSVLLCAIKNKWKRIQHSIPHLHFTSAQVGQSQNLSLISNISLKGLQACFEPMPNGSEIRT